MSDEKNDFTAETYESMRAELCECREILGMSSAPSLMSVSTVLRKWSEEVGRMRYRLWNFHKENEQLKKTLRDIAALIEGKV